MKRAFLDYVIGLQGLYYAITGLWPVISSDSFEQVTGPKNSLFLLTVTGLMIAIIGAALLLSFSKDKTREILFLALATPLAFIIIEVIFRASIRWVYFIDFAIEIIVFMLVLFGIWTMRTKRKLDNLVDKDDSRE